MRNAKKAARAALEAAAELRSALHLGADEKIRTGIVLGTGWGDALRLRDQHEVPFANIPGFLDIQDLPGHHRKVVVGKLGKQRVVMLSGRLHLNEESASKELDDMVRLQVEMLMALGVKRLILTCAGGSLKKKVHVGDIVTLDGFVSLFAPDLPGFAGEFHSPDDILDPTLAKMACKVIKEETGRSRLGGYVMVRGPFFEGRKYDKPILRATGASAVGMSMLPETAMASIHPDVKVIGLCFVTNTDSEDHSHDTNRERARKNSKKMGRVLTKIVQNLKR